MIPAKPTPTPQINQAQQPPAPVEPQSTSTKETSSMPEKETNTNNVTSPKSAYDQLQETVEKLRAHSKALFLTLTSYRRWFGALVRGS